MGITIFTYVVVYRVFNLLLKAYRFNFFGFVDKDECADPTLNDCMQRCENTVGGHLCRCWAGYKERSGHCRLTYIPDLGHLFFYLRRKEYNFSFN